MILVLEHKHLTVDLRTEESAHVEGDHAGRTKIVLSAKGSINPDGVNSVIGALAPIVQRLGLVRPPRKAASLADIEDDAWELAMNARALGIEYDKFLSIVLQEANKEWVKES